MTPPPVTGQPGQSIPLSHILRKRRSFESQGRQRGQCEGGLLAAEPAAPAAKAVSSRESIELFRKNSTKLDVSDLSHRILLLSVFV